MHCEISAQNMLGMTEMLEILSLRHFESVTWIAFLGGGATRWEKSELNDDSWKFVGSPRTEAKAQKDDSSTADRTEGGFT